MSLGVHLIDDGHPNTVTDRGGSVEQRGEDFKERGGGG
jgi:hypothetical protein